MRFYGYFRSSAAHRCRIAFNLKGLTPETVAVNLREGQQGSPAFRRLNPQGLVPMLDTGRVQLTQSLAIIEWLDETQPGPRLLPEDPDLRAEVRGFAQVIACDTHPLQNLRVQGYLKTELGQDQTAVEGWLRQWISAGLDACETLAAARPDGQFLFGDTPGLAEICLIPQMLSAERFGVATAPYPRLNRVRAACEALPTFADAHPARQPDAT